MYNWGSVGKNGGVGKNGDLASMLERIDFGPAEMQARSRPREIERPRDSPRDSPRCARVVPALCPRDASLCPRYARGLQAEGVAAARSFIQPVGELRQAVLEVRTTVSRPTRHAPRPTRHAPRPTPHAPRPTCHLPLATLLRTRVLARGCNHTRHRGCTCDM